MFKKICAEITSPKVRENQTIGRGAVYFALFVVVGLLFTYLAASGKL